jgi:putative Holliday junction resolvase
VRVLALDIGERRVGCAFGDTEHLVAVPLKVLPADQVEGLARPFLQLLEDYEPQLLLSGLPLTMAGERGKQAERVEAIARKVSASTGIELAFVDERLSSAQAKRIMHEQGMSERQMRGKLDSVAASLFLQSWLESRASVSSEDA